MSDLELGKKEEERIALDYFLDAYAFTTGNELEYTPLASDSERPDFICRSESGELVGVEITRVMVQPDVRSELVALGISRQLDGFQASEAVFAAIEEKDRKRCSPGWRLAEDTILVIQVLDTEVDALGAFYSGANIYGDYADFGFREIWIADCASIEAYGGVTLIGLHPPKWWGPHERWNHFQKPYG